MIGINALLLVLRLLLGVVFLAHGAQKAFGAFGGPGLAGMAGFLGSLGMQPPRFWAVVAAYGELLGALLVALGLFTPLGALLIAATMAVATIKVHGPKGFFIQNGGYEHALVLLVLALALAVAGPGAYSLDALLRR